MAAALLAASAAGLVAWPSSAPADPPSAAAPAADAPSIVIPELPAPPPPTSADIMAAEPASAAAPASPSAPAGTPREAAKPVAWETMAIGELRSKAEASEVPAMEELARRLLEGAGVTRDQPAGAGWLFRAAEAGSARSAFNVGVMYERGFVVDRDSARAITWYRKAAEAGVPAAKHNLALLLRDGKGTARNGKEAIELLRSAALQGMAASMFTLGDIYERGDAAPKDLPMALGWFAVTAEFERQTNRDTDTALSRTATQRVQTLQRILTPAERERGRKLGQQEFDRIVAALQPARPAPVQAVPPPSAIADSAGWGKTVPEQVRAIQQILFDMGFLREKPDGALGPVTRTAIRTFQKSAGLRETGQPTREVYIALRGAARRDVVANSPLPPPPKDERAPAEPAAPAPADTAAAAVPAQLPDAARQEAAKADLAPYPTAFVDQVKAVQTLLRTLDFYRDDPDGALGSGTRNAIRSFQKSIGMRETGEPTRDVHAALQEAVQRASTGGSQPEPPEPARWPVAPRDQIKAIQGLLHELKLYRGKVDGTTGPATRAAIREYQKSAGLAETGEPNQATFEALRKARASQTADRPN